MTALAQIHSTQQLEEVTLIEKREKDFVVKTKRGVYCTAIYNIFTSRFYADDIYGVIEDYDKEDSTT